MRFLTEEKLVRKAVIEGLGRVLRQSYTEEQVGPPTEHITRLLARFSSKALPGEIISECLGDFVGIRSRRSQ